MDDMTPEQAAILDLLRRIEALEETVQLLTTALAVQVAPKVLAVPRRLTANPDLVRLDRGRIARS